MQFSRGEGRPASRERAKSRVGELHRALPDVVGALVATGLVELGRQAAQREARQLKASIVITGVFLPPGGDLLERIRDEIDSFRHGFLRQ